MSFIVGRIMQVIPILLIVTMIVFVLLNVVGDPVRLMLPEDATEEDIARLRTELGLDQPIHIRYGIFLANVVRGDFGESYQYKQPALPVVLDRVPVTLTVAFWAMFTAVAMSIPLGVIAAIRRNSILDLLATGAAVIGRAMPNFWLGLMLILIVAVKFRLLPVSGVGSWKNLVLPVITLGSGMAATLTRLMRSSMLEVIRQDFITTARAKGVAERVVIYKHALRNALIPVVTIMGLQLIGLLEGSFITETIFAIPGSGRLALKALNSLDFAIVLTVVILGSVLVVVSNLCVDVVYTFIDPRIRYG